MVNIQEETMEKVKIDPERMQVTTSLADPETKVLLISEGKVRYFEMADFGQFTAKTHEGKVTFWENAERGKM